MRVDLSTYGDRLLEPGYVGQVVDLNTSSIFNYKNEGPDPIDFGLFVARGSKADTCKLPSAADSEILGISVRHVTMVANQGGDVLYLKDAMVPALEIGRIRVICESGCTPGEPVYIRFAKGAAAPVAVRVVFGCGTLACADGSSA